MEFKRGKLSNEQLIHLYKSLLLPRMIEDKMLLLLRQGKISKWFSGIGQEAISVGATLAMDPTEWIMPLHRNLGVFTTRDMPLTDLFKQWQGSISGTSNPTSITMDADKSVTGVFESSLDRQRRKHSFLFNYLRYQWQKINRKKLRKMYAIIKSKF
jgi:TPP-dependent pyruvate/acetoin dehydrogenase alpha subunit